MYEALLLRIFWRVACFSGPFRRRRRFFALRMGGKVKVRRSFMANLLVWVWATGEEVVRALRLREVVPGNRLAVWPSRPIPRIIRSKGAFGSCFL